MFIEIGSETSETIWDPVSNINDSSADKLKTLIQQENQKLLSGITSLLDDVSDYSSKEIRSESYLELQSIADGVFYFTLFVFQLFS